MLCSFLSRLSLIIIVVFWQIVVILSLFFWGWVWGPAGMLLSVPMTVVVKLLLELSPDTRWLGVLLGPAQEVEDHPAIEAG